ncbi:MAG: hypothetical protein JNM07_13070 [Phycisphaerae bacterium]|nr:hypothetical protein [Phycisphaerae bacterium]
MNAAARPRFPVHRARPARGFTLLEVTLAAILGATVVMACSAMFMSLDRGQRLAETKLKERQELVRTHRTVTRALRLLLMSDLKAPAKPIGAAASDVPDPGANLPRRMTLEPDATLVDGVRFQRFELVLRADPIYLHESALDQPGSDANARAKNATSSAAPAFGGGGSVIRGVFEVRPASPAPGAGIPTPRPAGPSLWWRIIPPDGSVGGEVELVRDLASVHWIARAKNESSDTLRALRPDDLPAYIQLKLQTRSGGWADWMFEVMWRSGSEDQTADETDDGVKPSGAGGGPSGRTGAGSRPGGPASSGPSRQVQPAGATRAPGVPAIRSGSRPPSGGGQP